MPLSYNNSCLTLYEHILLLLPQRATCSFPSLGGYTWMEQVRTSPFQVSVIVRLGRNWPTDSKPRELLGEIFKKRHLSLLCHIFSWNALNTQNSGLMQWPSTIYLWSPNYSETYISLRSQAKRNTKYWFPLDFLDMLWAIKKLFTLQKCEKGYWKQDFMKVTIHTMKKIRRALAKLYIIPQE